MIVAQNGHNRQILSINNFVRLKPLMAYPTEEKENNKANNFVSGRESRYEKMDELHWEFLAKPINKIVGSKFWS
jgi:hypothetical protein